MYVYRFSRRQTYIYLSGKNINFPKIMINQHKTNFYNHSDKMKSLNFIQRCFDVPILPRYVMLIHILGITEETM